MLVSLVVLVWLLGELLLLRLNLVHRLLRHVSLRLRGEYVVLHLLLNLEGISSFKYVFLLGLFSHCCLVLSQVHLTAYSTLINKVRIMLLSLGCFLLLLHVSLLLVVVLLSNIILVLLFSLQSPVFNDIVLPFDELIL